VSRMTKMLDSKAKDMKLDDTLARVNMAVAVGNYSDSSVQTSLSLMYSQGEEKLQQTLKDLGNPKGNTVLAAYFSIKPNVDDFVVGELSSVLKDVLLVAKKELKFEESKTNIINVDGKKYYVIGITIKESQGTSVQGVSDAVGLKKLEFGLQVNQSTKRGDESANKPLAFQLDLNAEVPRGAVDILNEISSFEEDPDLMTVAQQRTRYWIQILQSFMNLNLKLKFHDLKDFYGGMLGIARLQTEEMDSNTAQFGFNTARDILAKSLGGFMPELPQNFQDAYHSASNVFGSLERVVAHTGPHCLEVKVKGLEVSELLPTKEDLAKFALEDDEL